MAISALKIIPLAPGVSLLTGDYAQTIGSANLTFTLGGQRVLMMAIHSADSNGDIDVKWGNFSQSVSGSTNTVMVQGIGAVTTGKIFALVASGI